MIEAFNKLDAMLRKERDDAELAACEADHKLELAKAELKAERELVYGLWESLCTSRQYQDWLIGQDRWVKAQNKLPADVWMFEVERQVMRDWIEFYRETKGME